MEFQLITLILIILALVIVALAVVLGGAAGWMIINFKRIMAKVEQFNAVLSRIDTATTDIANDLREVREQLATALQNAGVPSEEEESILQKLSAAADKLEGIAQNPEDPTPGIPETPEEPGTPETPEQPEA